MSESDKKVKEPTTPHNGNWYGKGRLNAGNRVSPRRPNKDKLPCVFCKAITHESRNCNNPKNPSKDRMVAVTTENLCRFCLKGGHQKADYQLYVKKILKCGKCRSPGHVTPVHFDFKDTQGKNQEKGNPTGGRGFNPTKL